MGTSGPVVGGEGPVDGRRIRKKEKEDPRVSQEGRTGLPKPDFSFFVSSLAMEILISLGDTENPITKKRHVIIFFSFFLPSL